MAIYTPQIQSSASTPGTRTGDRAELVASETVTLVDTNTSNTGGSRQWSILWQPPGSNISITNPTSNSATFVPVVPGTYVIECLYTVGRGTWRNYVYLAVPYPESGIRVPAAGEGGEDSRSFDDGGGDDYGYWGALNHIAAEVEDLVANGNGTRVSEDDTTSGNLEDKIVGAGDISVSVLNDGGNEQLQISVDLSSIESDISALDGRLDTAENDINNLEAADTALDGRLDTAESDISALEAADTALDGRLDTVEADIAALEADPWSSGGYAGLYGFELTGPSSESGVPHFGPLYTVGHLLPITREIKACAGVRISVPGGLLFAEGSYLVGFTHAGFFDSAGSGTVQFAFGRRLVPVSTPVAHTTSVSPIMASFDGTTNGLSPAPGVALITVGAGGSSLCLQLSQISSGNHYLFTLMSSLWVIKTG